MNVLGCSVGVVGVFGVLVLGVLADAAWALLETQTRYSILIFILLHATDQNLLATRMSDFYFKPQFCTENLATYANEIYISMKHDSCRINHSTC